MELNALIQNLMSITGLFNGSLFNQGYLELGMIEEFDTYLSLPARGIFGSSGGF